MMPGARLAAALAASDSDIAIVRVRKPVDRSATEERQMGRMQVRANTRRVACMSNAAGKLLFRAVDVANSGTSLAGLQSSSWPEIYSQLRNNTV